MRRRVLLPAVFAAALAGCSSDRATVYEKLAPLVQRQLLGAPEAEAEAGAEPAAMTRAELNKIPYATISVRIGDNPRAFVVPIANNGGYLVYQDAARRGVVMHGGLITATHGFGYNLDSVAHRRVDPVFARTPLAQWPATAVRSYDFTVRGRNPYEIAVVCAFERGVREVIEIVELRFEVVRVRETCANPERRFVNTYWVDPRSGFIWKSVQWVGPNLAQITVEIVRPFGGG